MVCHTALSYRLIPTIRKEVLPLFSGLLDFSERKEQMGR